MIQDSNLTEAQMSGLSPMPRPWWSRTWIWLVAFLTVALTTGAVVLSSSASAAGGCGGG